MFQNAFRCALSLAACALVFSACSKAASDNAEANNAPAAATPEAAAEAPKALAVKKDTPTKAHAATLVGKPAPDFTLTDLDGKKVSLASFKGKTVVLEWFNPQCPFVKAAHGPGSLKDAAARHTKDGVVWLAINSGAPGKQGHDPEVNKKAVKDWSLNHPVLQDESGETGRIYGATNTPQMFVIDKTGNVVYAGAIDNSPDGEGKSPQGGKLINHVDTALGELAAGKPITTPVTKAYGCGVKYSS